MKIATLGKRDNRFPTHFIVYFIVTCVTIFSANSSIANNCSSLFWQSPNDGSYVDVKTLFYAYRESLIKFRTIKMRTRYIEEDRRLSINYFKEDERDRYKLFRYASSLYNSNGYKITNGKYMAIMDMYGNIFAVPSYYQDILRIHHSSFTSASSLAWSGHIYFKNGKVVGIDNVSGHYTPPAWMALQLVSRLREMGITLEENYMRDFEEQSIANPYQPTQLELLNFLSTQY